MGTGGLMDSTTRLSRDGEPVYHYSFLSTFADRLQGDLWIATGYAMLVRRAGEGGRRIDMFEKTAGWRGAFLCLDAPVPGW